MNSSPDKDHGVYLGALPSLKCKLISHSFDCDDCGAYTDVECKIDAMGESYKFCSDGHFGGGTWDGQDSGLCKLALKRLGVKLYIQDGYELEQGAQPVNLDEMGVYDANQSGYDGLVPLSVKPLEGLDHGLKSITLKYAQSPTDEHCGELWMLLNESETPFMVFCYEGVEPTAKASFQTERLWWGGEYDALYIALQAMGILKIKSKSKTYY